MKRSSQSLLLCVASVAAITWSACKTDKAASEPAAKPAAEAPAPAPDAGATPAVVEVKYDRVPRAAFNMLTAQAALPVFWKADANNNNTLEPSELAVLWGMDGTGLVVDGKFSPAFTAGYEKIVALHTTPAAEPPAGDAEAARRAAIRKELAQGRPTLLAADFSAGTPEERAIVKAITDAAVIIERIHFKQSGAFGMEKDIPADDTASRTAFWRNQGPWCSAPETEADPNCNALPSKPARVVGVYPADMQADAKFCEVLGKDPNAKALMEPFVVVQKDAAGKLAAVPYNVAYKEDMEAVSALLKGAADAITSAEEAAFKAYLQAAAQSFLDNNWQPADEAWSKMNNTNSKWYLRIGPDEVYWEPCSRKAGFHVSFARINPGSVAWQQKLEPVKTDLEKALADLAGKPYKARKVAFHMPDFIDIVLNAGDSRPALGATIGQSLPNWGPVANEGRGRTVAMVNLYTDPDSKQTAQQQAESVYCKDTMAAFTTDEAPAVMATVLHEAAHNLGPAHEYKVKNKTDDEIFGGPLASMLEELKAQTSSLYLAGWLLEKKLVTPEEAQKSWVHDVSWAFGHISRGMYEKDGKIKAYSQLASIQAGFLFKEGVLTWRAEEMAANGTDKGCFNVALDKFGAAATKLEKVVLGIKGRGDKALADKTRAEFVDQEGEWKKLHSVIQERYRRFPRASFVYAVAH